MNNPLAGTDPTGYCATSDTVKGCAESLGSGESRAITDGNGKEVGTVGKDKDGNLHVTRENGSKGAQSIANVMGGYQDASSVGSQSNNSQVTTVNNPTNSSGADKYVGMAGVAAMGDSPAPGPGDVIAVGLLITAAAIALSNSDGDSDTSMRVLNDVLTNDMKLGNAASPPPDDEDDHYSTYQKDFDDLADMRQSLGKNPGEGTIARLEIGGETHYGINAHGQRVTLRVNPISRTHAETDAFQQAVNARSRGDTARLVVDRELCGACGTRGAVKSMARQLGIKELEVITPANRVIIKP